MKAKYKYKSTTPTYDPNEDVAHLIKKAINTSDVKEKDKILRQAYLLADCMVLHKLIRLPSDEM